MGRQGADSPLTISLRREVPSPTAAWDGGAALARRLLEEPGVTRCELTVNANRRQVVSWRVRAGVLTVSVHWALLPHIDDVARLVGGDRSVWPRLRRELPREAPVAAHDEVAPTGHVHDLVALLDAERAWLRRDTPEVRVTWGRWSSAPPRQSLRLGSCQAGDPPLLRVHPVLDHAAVPGWFVGFVLYHELLHVLYPPVDRGTRRVVHPPSFRAAERRHPRYAEALAWERGNIDQLLSRARRRIGHGRGR